MVDKVGDRVTRGIGGAEVNALGSNGDTLDRFVARAAREEARKAEVGLWQMPYLDYLVQVIENPALHLRASAQLMRDMFEHFGYVEETDRVTGERRRRNLVFDDVLGNGKNRVYGNDRLLSRVLEYVNRRAAEIEQRKLMIFYGPPGTAKSQIIELIKNALVHFTATEQGLVATAAFAFDEVIGETRGAIGFARNGSSSLPIIPTEVSSTYTADFKDSPVQRLLRGEKLRYETVTCPKHCHPLLYLPKDMRMDFFYTIYLHHLLKELKEGSKPDEGLTIEERERLIEIDRNYTIENTLSNKKELGKARNDLIDQMRAKYSVLKGVFLPEELRTQDPCKQCSTILHELMVRNGVKNEDGSRTVDPDAYLQIINGHILVQRLLFMPNEAGLAVIDAKDPGSQGAVIQKSTAQQDLSEALPGISRVYMEGPYLVGNRGIVEIIELLKDTSRLLALLSVIGEATVPLAPNLSEHIDLTCLASTNARDISELLERNETISRPLRERSELFDCRYLTRISDERKIYEDQRQRIVEHTGMRFEPYTVDMITLFAIATRLLPPDKTNYASSGRLAKLGTIIGENPLSEDALGLISALTPIEKAYLLDGNPEILHKDKRRLINQRLIKMLALEYDAGEGMSGMSPRAVKKIYSELSRIPASSIAFFDFEVLIQNRISSRKEKDRDEFFGIEMKVDDQGDEDSRRYGKYGPSPSQPNNSYMDVKDILELVREEYLRLTKDDIVESLTGIRLEDVVKRFDEYLAHLRASVTGENVRNPHTQLLTEPDQKLMRKFEEWLGDKGTTSEVFRQRIMTTYTNEAIAAKREKRAIYSTLALFEDDLKHLRYRLYAGEATVFYNLSDLGDQIQAMQEKDAAARSPGESNRDPVKKACEIVYQMIRCGYSFDGARKLLLVHIDKIKSINMERVDIGNIEPENLPKDDSAENKAARKRLIEEARRKAEEAKRNEMYFS